MISWDSNLHKLSVTISEESSSVVGRWQFPTSHTWALPGDWLDHNTDALTHSGHSLSVAVEYIIQYTAHPITARNFLWFCGWMHTVLTTPSPHSLQWWWWSLSLSCCCNWCGRRPSPCTRSSLPSRSKWHVQFSASSYRRHGMRSAAASVAAAERQTPSTSPLWLHVGGNHDNRPVISRPTGDV